MIFIIGVLKLVRLLFVGEWSRELLGRVSVVSMVVSSRSVMFVVIIFC